jgi:serine/threonine protein kinase
MFEASRDGDGTP